MQIFNPFRKRNQSPFLFRLQRAIISTPPVEPVQPIELADCRNNLRIQIAHYLRFTEQRCGRFKRGKGFHFHLTEQIHCPFVLPTATASITSSPVLARSHKAKNSALDSVTIWRGLSVGTDAKDNSICLVRDMLLCSRSSRGRTGWIRRTCPGVPVSAKVASPDQMHRATRPINFMELFQFRFTDQSRQVFFDANGRAIAPARRIENGLNQFQFHRFLRE